MTPLKIFIKSLKTHKTSHYKMLSGKHRDQAAYAV